MNDTNDMTSEDSIDGNNGNAGNNDIIDNILLTIENLPSYFPVNNEKEKYCIIEYKELAVDYRNYKIYDMINTNTIPPLTEIIIYDADNKKAFVFNNDNYSMIINNLLKSVTINDDDIINDLIIILTYKYDYIIITSNNDLISINNFNNWGIISEYNQFIRSDYTIYTENICTSRFLLMRSSDIYYYNINISRKCNITIEFSVKYLGPINTN